MSGDDHFIKPDNDHPPQSAGRYSDRERRLNADVAALTEQLAAKDAALASCRESVEVLCAEQVIWRQADRALREEIAKHQRNVRHWREECGKLHAQLAKAKADLHAWEMTRQRMEEAERPPSPG